MGGVCTDVLLGFLPVEQANASANAMGKMLKAIEMQYKYGRPHQPHANLDFRK